jgi:hypothetical protein
MFAISFCLILLILLINKAYSNECTDNCDIQYTTGLKVKFCGTDLITHVTYSSAFDSNCYDICGVMTYYQGDCGCPNDCYNSILQGQCINNECICNLGWGGYDCSLPIVSNKCSMHGHVEKNLDIFPFEYCLCDDDYTGTDCSTKILPFDSLPWGTLFDGDIYSSSDQYGDSHPIWNISVLPTIKLELDNEDYLSLLDAHNLDNDIYYKSNFYFDNGNVQIALKDVGLRLKGHSSRLQQKKGWNIKFNKFIENQTLFDIEKLGFKPGNTNDDALIKQLLYIDFLRAMNVPTQRSSYTLMYINNIFVGLYNMQENIDTKFMMSRINNDNGQGNNMKLFWTVVLQYFGSNSSYYENKVTTNCLNDTWNYYEQESGDGNWSDFIDLLYFFNSTSDLEFYNKISNQIELTSLLRMLTIESFMLATDNIASGNNYFLYHKSNDKNQSINPYSLSQWIFVTFDYDECLSIDDNLIPNEITTDIFLFFDKSISDPDEADPLLIRLLNIKKYKDIYINNYNIFINNVFGKNTLQHPSKRYSLYLDFAYPWICKDKLWQITFGMTCSQFYYDAIKTIKYLPIRYQNVSNQLFNL